ncbi:hypothetical protein LR48_Vigan08g009200 [Vigna angularis]|uniref:Peptidase A1 domain-containing protein n=1 Tax=Phaseolus angularis TaxID=3914 RepID=A0A0L9V2B1_PHAAN|nr:hypothetical protein LR48_Vigan08g009200 [Vigna angularis]
MNYSVGTPPVQILGIVDTGSDIIWMQCQPCKDCYKQDRPIFDPSTSRTYSTIPCVSADCLSASHTFCNFNNGKRCAYKVTYGDGSTSEGDFSWDTITLTFSTKNVPVAFPQTVIGCGHNNYGIFGEQSSGIVGLGIGAFSLAGQLKPKIGGTFSYCLTPMYEGDAKPSYLHFGDSGEVSVEGAVSTPLIRNIARPSMYFVVMEAISVGSKRIEFPRNGSQAILGNLAQQDILIGYDTQRNTVTFLNTDCTSEL